MNPRAAAAQLELSRLQLASGQTSAAIQLAEASAKNAPATVGTSLAVVRSLIAAKNLARAEAELARVRAQAPHVAAVHVQAGVLASLRHDSRRARESFEQARTLDPHSVDALAGLVALSGFDVSFGGEVLQGSDGDFNDLVFEVDTGITV